MSCPWFSTNLSVIFAAGLTGTLVSFVKDTLYTYDLLHVSFEGNLKSLTMIVTSTLICWSHRGQRL